MTLGAVVNLTLAETSYYLRADGRTDGQKDNRTIEGYNIIPRHLSVAGYNKPQQTSCLGTVKRVICQRQI